MIGRLCGLVVEHHLDGSVIVDVGGVGYEVFVPLGTLGRLPAPPEKVVLHVHTHQPREDPMVLYGFASLEDRSAFRALVGVSTIGPKLALSILGNLGAAELADAIQRQDRTRFKGISGVGKKIVERLMLELKDKLGPARGMPPAAAKSAAPPPPAVTGNLAVVHGALVQMGFKPGEADAACEKVQADSEGKAAEQLLREALTVLA